ALIDAASRFQKQQKASRGSSSQRQSGKPQKGNDQSSQQASSDEPTPQVQQGKGDAQAKPGSKP
ncbi:MAG: hypothetical protein EBX57_12265, partial [Betaproteobacteria bacterium]|nr:hypothetical protein [Betaproteobacteria bacterium]